MNLSGSNGFFPRIGTLSKMLADVNNYQATTLVNDVGTIYGQFTSGQDITDGIATQVTAAQQAAGNITSFLQQIATQTANEMVQQFQPQLTNTNLAESLNFIIGQMNATSGTVLRMTVGNTISGATTNVGNGVVTATSLRYDGLPQENQYAELITATCTIDATTRPTVSGHETFTFHGQLSQSPFSQLWPGGSACNVQVNGIDGGSSALNNNLLTNSDFETFTSGVPSGWVIASGTAGTNIKQSTTNVYSNSGSLQFLSTDGSGLMALSQPFNNASGTTGTLTYQTIYGVNGWFQSTSTSGILEVALTDQSGNITVNTISGQNKVTQNVTSGGWTAFNGFFQTPYIQPSAYNLRLRLTGALKSGQSVYVDKLAMGQATALYPFGPSVCYFPGASGAFSPDTFYVTTTNTRGSGGTLRTAQTVAQRYYNMGQLGLLLPSAVSGSNTISDSMF